MFESAIMLYYKFSKASLLSLFCQDGIRARDALGYTYREGIITLPNKTFSVSGLTLINLPAKGRKAIAGNGRARVPMIVTEPFRHKIESM